MAAASLIRARTGVIPRVPMISALVISGLAKVGLAHDVVVITPERQAQKALAPEREKVPA